MIRIIHFDRGSEERIYITDDMDAWASEFIPDGWDIISDTKIEGELPYSFPMNNTFSIER